MRYVKKLFASLAAVLLCGSLSSQTDIELVTASYFGGIGVESQGSMMQSAVGIEDGGWFMGCLTTSSNFWTSADAYISERPGPSAMGITRFDPSGIPVYSTYLGGNSLDNFFSIDMLGDSVVVGGATQSADYPISVGAFQSDYPGVPSGVLTCFDPQGDLAWSTYIGGGAGYSTVAGVHVSEENAIFITGFTHHPNLATPGVHMESFAVGQNASDFIARFNSNGDLVWCTYYDRGALALTSSPDGSRIYTYVLTSNQNPVSESPHQANYGGGPSDAFLACFDAETGTLIWETFFGGEGEDWIGGIDVDENGMVYITGTSWSMSGITTPGTHQVERAGDTDAFIACFYPDGEQSWGTYFGGQGFETASLPKIRENSLYVAGITNSPIGIAFGNPVQPTMLGTSASYLTKFNQTNGTLEWATYIASTPSGNCSSAALEVLVGEKLLLRGAASGSCPGFITPNAWQPTFGGGDFDVWYAIYSDNTLSTTNNISKSAVQAFPNPAKDVLTIHPNSTQANAAFAVHDISGRVVMQGILGLAQTQLVVGHLPAGLYLLRVEGLENMPTLKFIKE